MEREITGNGPLLDAGGRLRERGWSRRPVLAYDRAAITAPAWRIKEWDYYCVLGPERGLALTIADNGYMGFLSASVLDLAEGGHVSDSVMTAFPMGAMRLPGSSEEGKVEVSAGTTILRFEAGSGERRLFVSWPGFGAKDAPRLPRASCCGSLPPDEARPIVLRDRISGGVGLEGELVLSEIPAGESMTIATPFAGDGRRFYYNRKVNCMSARGSFRLGNLETRLEPESAFGVLDWGRGVWPYANLWYWASASGLVGASDRPKRFGFNLGYGFGDTSAASENALFLEGRAHKLGRLTFEIDPADFLRPWRIRDEEGRLDLRLDPSFDRSSKTDLLALASIQHQVFGTWSGRARLDDGTELTIEGLKGFAEEVKNRW